MKKYVLFTLASIIFSANACKKPSNSGEERGYATGKAVDSKGKPLAGVEVTLENTTFHEGYTSTTDKSGNYKIKLSKNGAYSASAYIDKTLNNIVYHLPLHTNDKNYFSQEGGVVNFELKLTGQKPEGGHYGGEIQVSADINDLNPIEDQENIELTLTPLSKLVDGTEAAVVKLNLTRISLYYGLVDIPIARYSVSAKYKGSVLKLKIRDTNNAYQNNVTVDFPADIYSGAVVGLSYSRN
ncbi:carboxypeptidase-like regulatory domain-containing protein [Pedobacter montanisoli]|uniref:Carboxypeptidase-like regulatory domain-containing protein n=1 Tax=Pedobacter montanisoli TaxID=2923277 RepID=A0ABS9ZYX1_9SPHI|nr:carboxypeptidase-like regulatory domain-containing protein [Pedobacter montanisoli]MCJ0743502.1 carboxypeptidase-like regulatory domain-containing protein [Pedobacter montanisoli]